MTNPYVLKRMVNGDHIPNSPIWASCTNSKCPSKKWNDSRQTSFQTMSPILTVINVVGSMNSPPPSGGNSRKKKKKNIDFQQASAAGQTSVIKNLHHICIQLYTYVAQMVVMLGSDNPNWKLFGNENSWSGLSLDTPSPHCCCGTLCNKKWGDSRRIQIRGCINKIEAFLCSHGPANFWGPGP